MEKNNILEPFVDLILDVGKLTLKGLYKLIGVKECYDMESFFKSVNLKNKQDLYPKVIKIHNSPKGYTYVVSVPTGLDLESFNKYKEALEIQIKNNVEIKNRGDGYIEIEVITVKLDEKINYTTKEKEKDSIYLPFAKSLEGIEYLDLKEIPHTLCTGTTGSGKSVTTRNILTSLITMYPDSVDLYLIDFKIVELSIFKNLKQTKKYANEVEDAKEIISDLLAECKRRYKLFEDVGVNNLYDYNKKVAPKDRLKMQFIVVEEFVMLLEDKKKHAMGNLKKLASLSRASGQFLYITAQRFDNTIIDLVLRSLIGNRLCHRVESINDSKLILDTEGAERLRGNGHLIYKSGSRKVECQSFFINDSQIKENIKPYAKKYTPKVVGEPHKVLEFKKEYKVKKELETLRNENTDLDWINKI